MSRTWLAPIAALLLVLAACDLAEDSFSSAEALRGRLQRAGVPTQILDTGHDDIFGASFTSLCASGQRLSVYAFADETAAQRAAASIDPRDPSHISNAQMGNLMIVEWVGRPRFWQGGRLIVLYAGPDEGFEALLTSVLGSPFAKGLGRDFPAGHDPGC